MTGVLDVQMWYLYENGCKQCPCHYTVSPSISSSQINIRNLPSWSSIDQIIFSFPASFSVNHISFYLSLWWPGHPGFFLLRYIYFKGPNGFNLLFNTAKYGVLLWFKIASCLSVCKVLNVSQICNLLSVLFLLYVSVIHGL